MFPRHPVVLQTQLTSLPQVQSNKKALGMYENRGALAGCGLLPPSGAALFQAGLNPSLLKSVVWYTSISHAFTRFHER